MRVQLETLSSWVSVTFQGIVFAASLVAWALIGDHQSWPRAVGPAVVVTPLYMVTMWFATRRQRRATDAVLGPLTSQQRRAVVRAADTGTPPADPSLRASAAALVADRIAEHERHRTFPRVVFAALLALSVLLAVTDGPWYLLGTVMSGWALVWAVRYPAWLRARLAALAPPPETVPVGSAPHRPL